MPTPSGKALEASQTVGSTTGGSEDIAAAESLQQYRKTGQRADLFKAGTHAISGVTQPLATAAAVTGGFGAPATAAEYLLRATGASYLTNLLAKRLGASPEGSQFFGALAGLLTAGRGTEKAIKGGAINLGQGEIIPPEVNTPPAQWKEGAVAPGETRLQGEVQTPSPHESATPVPSAETSPHDISAVPENQTPSRQVSQHELKVSSPELSGKAPLRAPRPVNPKPAVQPQAALPPAREETAMPETSGRRPGVFDAATRQETAQLDKSNNYWNLFKSARTERLQLQDQIKNPPKDMNPERMQAMQQRAVALQTTEKTMFRNAMQYRPKEEVAQLVDTMEQGAFQRIAQAKVLLNYVQGDMTAEQMHQALGDRNLAADTKGAIHQALGREPYQTYRVLNRAVKKPETLAKIDQAKQEIKAMLADQTIPEDQRNKLHKILYTDEIDAGGRRTGRRLERNVVKITQYKKPAVEQGHAPVPGTNTVIRTAQFAPDETSGKRPTGIPELNLETLNALLGRSGHRRLPDKLEPEQQAELDRLALTGGNVQQKRQEFVRQHVAKIARTLVDEAQSNLEYVNIARQVKGLKPSELSTKIKQAQGVAIPFTPPPPTLHVLGPGPQGASAVEARAAAQPPAEARQTPPPPPAPKPQPPAPAPVQAPPPANAPRQYSAQEVAAMLMNRLDAGKGIAGANINKLESVLGIKLTGRSHGEVMKDLQRIITGKKARKAKPMPTEFQEMPGTDQEMGYEERPAIQAQAGRGGVRQGEPSVSPAPNPPQPKPVPSAQATEAAREPVAAPKEPLAKASTQEAPPSPVVADVVKLSDKKREAAMDLLLNKKQVTIDSLQRAGLYPTEADAFLTEMKQKGMVDEKGKLKLQSLTKAAKRAEEPAPKEAAPQFPASSASKGLPEAGVNLINDAVMQRTEGLDFAARMSLRDKALAFYRQGLTKQDPLALKKTLNILAPKTEGTLGAKPGFMKGPGADNPERGSFSTATKRSKAGEKIAAAAADDPGVVTSWLDDFVNGPTLSDNDKLKLVLRKYAGRNRAEAALVAQTIKTAVKAHSGDSTADLAEYMDAGEGKPGARELSPEDQMTVKYFHDQFDTWLERGQKVGMFKGDDFSPIEQYLAHLNIPRSGQGPLLSAIFQGAFSGGTFGRGTSMRGQASPTKHRFYRYESDAIRAGVTPVTNNFVEMQFLALKQLMKAVSAHEAFNEIKQRGFAVYGNRNKLLKAGKIANNWESIDDRMFQPQVPNDEVGGMVSYGKWWMPPDMARTMNNWLSPSLRQTLGPVGGRAFEAYRWGSNIAGQALMALPTFHLTTETIVAMQNDFATALDNLFAGKPLIAARQAIRGVTPGISSIHLARTGAVLRDAFGHPGRYPHLDEIVNWAVSGGLDYDAPSLYKNSAQVMRFMQRWTSGPMKNKFIAVGLNGVPAALEKTFGALAVPMRDWYIPRLKWGAFFTSFQPKLEELRARGASPDEILAQASRTVDVIEDRFGQLQTDNLMWPRWAKEVLGMTTLFPGWNIGTARSFVTGMAKDTARFGAQVLRGKPKAPSQRMTFFVAAFAALAVLNGIYQWLYTGKRPEGIDFIAPQNPDGTRVMPKSYGGDTMSLVHAPGKTLANKAHPFLRDLYEIYTNSDWEGRAVYNEEDNLIGRKGLDIAEHVVGKNMLDPIALEKFNRMREMGFSRAQAAITAMTPYQPAPYWLDKSNASNLVHELYLHTREQGPNSADTVDQHNTMRLLRRALANDNTDVIDRLVDSGKVSPEMMANAMTARNLTPFQYEFSQLPLENMLRVWNVATQDEKSQLVSLLETKAINKIPTLPTDQQEAMRQKYLKAMENF